MGDQHSRLLPGSANEAIEAARGRVARAVDANDAEAVVGASKDLAETVAKVVLDAMGGSYGSDAPLPKLASMAMKVLEIDPSRPALQRLGGSLISAAGSIAELRNSDGTGHGRSARSTLGGPEAEFVRAATSAWCAWLLAIAEQRLADSTRIDAALVDISGSRVYRTGQLKTQLDELALDGVSEPVQRKVGLAVARRWTINGTFMPRIDVIDPLAEGSADFPVAFQDGVIEGLLVDSAGRLRMSPDNIRISVEIAMRLRPRQRQTTLAQLAEHIEDAAPSPTFDHVAQAEAASLLHALADEHRTRDPERSLERIAKRLDDLAAESGGDS